MKDYVLLGRKGEVKKLSLDEWKMGLVKAAGFLKNYTKFMSEEHHLVRNHVARELCKYSKPIDPDTISQELQISVERVRSCLSEIYKAHAFLHLDEDGAVEWACPTTLASTPHRLSFSTGEKINAA